MIIMKHIEYQILNLTEMRDLLSHLDNTTSQVSGVTLQEIWFPKGKKEFVLILECDSEDRYMVWRNICPPPLGAKDWYEVFLSKEECFLK